MYLVVWISFAGFFCGDTLLEGESARIDLGRRGYLVAYYDDSSIEDCLKEKISNIKVVMVVE